MSFAENQGSPADSSAVDRAVNSGCRRLAFQVALREGLSALALVLGGVVLLLALGAIQFPPILVGVFLVAGVATAVYEWRRRRPRPYEVAQLLDESYRSHDQISTAYFFSRHSDAGGPANSIVASRAAKAAEHGDPSMAFPFRVPRVAYAVVGLAVLAGGLLVARTQGRFTVVLRPPATPGAPTPELNPLPPTEEMDTLPPEMAAQDPAQPLDRQGETEEIQDAIFPEDEAAASDDEPFEMPDVEGLSTGEEHGDEIASSQGEGEGGPDEKGTKSDEEATEQAENDPGGDWDEKSSGLLDRLQDAFRNMMENMGLDPPQAAEGQPQSSSEGDGSEESAEGGEQAEADANAAGGQPSDAEMEGGEPSDQASQQSAEGSGGEDSDQSAPNGQAASASGTGDGDKELAAQAETQAAMEALEEFYMQRAEDLTGEIMVETSSVEQDARMPYQPTSTQHADRGGAITRDEVPLAYQRFVQKYFENLRANEQ